MAKHNFQNDYPSVTRILNILRKVGLENWFKYNSAQFCNEESRRGKEVGKQIHEAIQNHIEETEVKVETQYAEEVSNALKGFMKFKREHPEITLKRAEMPLTSEIHKFNGIMDCLGKTTVPALFDWKTGKCKDKYDVPPIYDEHRYQVAAYFIAYNEIHEDQLKESYILVLAKDTVAYNLDRITKHLLESMFEQVFLPALKIYNYQKKGVWGGK